MEGAGNHVVTMAKLSRAAADVGAVASVSPATDLVHGAYYFMTLSYTPNAGGFAKTAQAFVIFDAVTQVPTLTSPADGSTASANFEIDFTLPEDALTGTVKVAIAPAAGCDPCDPAPQRVIAFGTAAEDVGRTRVDADGEDLASLAAGAPEVASVTPSNNLLHDHRHVATFSLRECSLHGSILCDR